MKTISLSLLFLSASFIVGKAQSNHPSKFNESKDVNVVYGSAVDTAAIYRVFEENAPKEFDIPGAPRFALVGKNEKFYLGVGAVLKTTFSFDFPDPIHNGAFFKPSEIPFNTTDGNGGLLQFNAGQSNFYINAVAMPGSKNKVGFYLNFDLLGDNYTPSLHNAYLTYRGFLVGYNASLFFEGKAVTPTIDKAGPNSSNYMAIPLIDYTHDFHNGIEVGVGLEMGDVSTTDPRFAYSVNRRLPDVPAYIEFYNKNDRRTNFRLSVLARDLQYYSQSIVGGTMYENEGRHNVFAWGVKGSGTLGLSCNFIVYYMAAYGRGIESYFRDFQKHGLDLVPYREGTDKMVAPAMWGGYIGLQYNWSRKCFSTVTYSLLRDYAENYPVNTDKTTLWIDQYKYGQYLAANVFYSITPELKWGLEWDWGRRVNFSGDSRHDNRIQTMLQLSF